jgi:hypothetical protein
MDYILNRCDEKSIDAVAAAVVRRRRELAMFGGTANLPDPKKMAREVSGQINVGASIDGLRETVRNMALRIIRQEAPELSEDQIAELAATWIPGGSKDRALPPDLIREMADQFVSFSTRRMSAAEEQRLRKEMGDWPQRYWKALPGVVRLLITDYLNGEIGEKEYLSKLDSALLVSG